jgi:hypothetical protein
MALKEKIRDDEIELLEILEDPIWFGEFIRETNGGSLSTKSHSPFNYRWYQKDILSDQTEKIVVVGGRSVGKCSPGYEKIYTTEGYFTLNYLIKHKSVFDVWSFNEETNRYEQKRAFVFYNGKEDVYCVRTKTGKSFFATAEHPMKTDKGYKRIDELSAGDKVAVVNYLPDIGVYDNFNWYELRLLGYLYGANRSPKPSSRLRLRFKRQINEIQLIAEYFGVDVSLNEDGYFWLKTNTDRLRNPIMWLLNEASGIVQKERSFFDSEGLMLKPREIPERIEKQVNKNLIVFLESFFSMVGHFKPPHLYICIPFREMANQLSEILLRFGIRTKRSIRENGLIWNDSKEYILEPEDVDLFLSIFSIPGIKKKDGEIRFTPFSYEEIEHIYIHKKEPTYGVFVHGTNTYISGDFYVHNSVVLEDMLLFNLVNGDKELPESPEQLFVTANVAQMTPVLDRVISRLMSSDIFSSFHIEPNRSKGTLDVFLDRMYRLYSRIAGKTGESNLVGLHVTNIFVDEAQILPKGAYYQMLPTWNTWQKKKRLVLFGVPNGMTRSNVLWEADNLWGSFKKYRIPATENPFFTRKDNEDAIAQYGGDKSDSYLNFVLGEHGSPTSLPISRNSIYREPREFFSYRFSVLDSNAGYSHESIIRTPDLEDKYRSNGLLFAIDSGFVQDTVLHIMGCDEKLYWRPLVRVTLTRIFFPEQAKIIARLNEYYKPDKIIFDYGSGGGGLPTSQILQDNYGLKNIDGVYFNQNVEIGVDSSGRPIFQQFKQYAAGHFVRMVLNGEIRFSEIDMEGISQLERIAVQRKQDGSYRYFVVSESASRGEDQNDHIFASYIVFAGFVALQKAARSNTSTPTKKLFGAGWIS